MARELPTDPWQVGPARLRRVRGPRDDGAVYWRATVREEGAVRQVWAGWCVRGDATVTAEVLGLATAPATSPTIPTVRTLLGHWRAEQEARAAAGEIAPNSIRIYRQAIRYLARGLGDVLLSRLDVATVRGYIAARTAGRVVLDVEDAGRRWSASSRTIHVELVQLEAAWTWARSRGLAPDHALDLPDHRPAATRARYTPTPAEVGAVLAHLPRPWMRWLVVLASATGARRGELASLRWRAVDLDRRVVELDGKTGPRLVPLGPAAIAVLREAAEGVEDLDALVLGVVSDTVESVGRHVTAACDAAGVPRWTPHALRRLAVDRLYESGADVGVVARLLGQSPTVALQAYRQPRPDALRRAVEVARLGSIPAGEVIDIEAHRVTGVTRGSGKPRE